MPLAPRLQRGPETAHSWRVSPSNGGRSVPQRPRPSAGGSLAERHTPPLGRHVHQEGEPVASKVIKTKRGTGSVYRKSSNSQPQTARGQAWRRGRRAGRSRSGTAARRKGPGPESTDREGDFRFLPDAPCPSPTDMPATEQEDPVGRRGVSWGLHRGRGCPSRAGVPMLGRAAWRQTHTQRRLQKSPPGRGTGRRGHSAQAEAGGPQLGLLSGVLIPSEDGRRAGMARSKCNKNAPDV